MLRRLANALRALDPRTLRQARHDLANLRAGLRALRADSREDRETLRTLRRAVSGLQQEIERLGGTLSEDLDAIRAELQRVADQTARLQVRESQLRVIAVADMALEIPVPELDALLSVPGLRAHVEAAVNAAPVVTEPFPHIVVDDLLPADFYAALVKGLPAAELFADKPPNEQRLPVPFRLAPRWGRIVWRHWASVLVPDVVRPLLLERFRAPIECHVEQHFPEFGRDPLERLTINARGGRLFLHANGYEIPPHRDPTWSPVTCLLYPARKRDKPEWGTQLYTVDGDRPAAGPTPHWIDPVHCRQVRDVEYKPNRLLALVNSHGAHGARVLDGDEAPPVRRFLYQVRLSPDAASRIALAGTLPEEERAAWLRESAP